MYSARKTTLRHGNTNLHILLINLIVISVLILQFGIDYLVIFISSTIIHIILETSLTLSGIRKGVVYVYGRKLPRAADVLLRSLVEGPAVCVPAFFVADQLMAGNVVIGIAVPALLVAVFSLYVGLADRRDLRRLGPGEAPIWSRRAMTKPRVVMFLALVNTGCLTALFLMPAPYRIHAFIYLIAYAILVMLFYIINYNLGVRMVQIYDYERKEYTIPGPLFQAAGLTYDSAYEMALVISPAYWVTFYLGLFHYTTIT